MNSLEVIHHLPLPELDRLYKSESNSPQARRLLAIIHLYEGKTLSQAARIARVSRRSVQTWVHRWNDGGHEGLKAKSQPGRPPTLTEEQEKTLIHDILRSPRDQGYEFTTWTLKDVAGHVKQRFGKTMTLSGSWRLLRRHEITRVVPRPMPAKADPQKKLSSWNA